MSRDQEALKRIEELANADIPDGWEQVDQVRTTAFTQRVLTYGSIVGATLCAVIGFTVFNFDPLLMLLAPVTTIGAAIITFALLMEELFVIAAVLFLVNIGSSLGDLAMAKRVSRIRKTHRKIWNRGTHFIAMKRPQQA